MCGVLLYNAPGTPKHGLYGSGWDRFAQQPLIAPSAAFKAQDSVIYLCSAQIG